MKHLTSYIFLIIAFLLLGVNGAAAQEKDCPFKVAVVGDNTDISYDNKVLSIRSSDKASAIADDSVPGLNRMSGPGCRRRLRRGRLRRWRSARRAGSVPSRSAAGRRRHGSARHISPGRQTALPVFTNNLK